MLSTLFCLALIATQSVVQGASFSNPLKDPNGSDPFMVYVDGYYYLTTTTWEDVQLTRATTLEGLKDGETKLVFKDPDPDHSFNVWAPEFHQIDDIWYCFYSASNESIWFEKELVLKGGPDIWEAEYTPHAALIEDIWAIDATILKLNSTNYYIYSRFDDVGQSLYIAELLSPSSIGESFVLSQPTEEWERIMGTVNEAAAPLYHDGRVWLTYSASQCASPSYQLGLLEYDGVSDPLDAEAWTKTGPVFSSSEGNYGTGHNGFFTSPDGTEVWNIYHATSIETGNCEGERYTMATKVTWKDDGSPDFGSAPPLGEELPGPSWE